MSDTAYRVLTILDFDAELQRLRGDNPDLLPFSARVPPSYEFDKLFAEAAETSGANNGAELEAAVRKAMAKEFGPEPQNATPEADS